MKTTLIISLAIFLLPLGFLVRDYGSEFFTVDSCLDSGGSYDYNKDKCDKTEDHPYISYLERKKAIMLICLTLSLAGLISSILININKHE